MRRRGFVILFAIAILALLGGLIWSYSAWTATQIRRQGVETTDAQLRQLVLAGLQLAPDALEARKSSATVELPADLSNAHLRLRIVEQDTSQAQVEVEACCGKHSHVQQASFVRDGDRWRMGSLAMP